MKKQLINYMTIETICSKANENFINSTVSTFASQMDLSEEEISDIKTVVSEAFTNAIIHAYKNVPGKISIRVAIFNGNVLEIKVRDWGCGIDNIEKAIEPMFTTLEDEHTGLGFTVMESYMDSVTVRSIIDKGTIVTMRKVYNTKEF